MGAGPPGTVRPSSPTPGDLDRAIARLLSGGTYLSIALLAIGTGLFLARGGSPLDAAPAFDLAAIPPDLVALRPTAFLWLGLVAVIATPSARVIASLIGYARNGEREMVAIAVLILAVIAVGVVLAQVAEA